MVFLKKSDTGLLTILTQAHIECSMGCALSRNRWMSRHRWHCIEWTVSAITRWAVTSVCGFVIWVGESLIIGTESVRFNSSFTFYLFFETAYRRFKVIRVYGHNLIYYDVNAVGRDTCNVDEIRDMVVDIGVGEDCRNIYDWGVRNTCGLDDGDTSEYDKSLCKLLTREVVVGTCLYQKHVRRCRVGSWEEIRIRRYHRIADCILRWSSVVGESVRWTCPGRRTFGYHWLRWTQSCCRVKFHFSVQNRHKVMISIYDGRVYRQSKISYTCGYRKFVK